MENDILKWWVDIDDCWKKLLVERIGVSSKPTLLELHQLILKDELNCSDAVDIENIAPISVFVHLRKLDLSGARRVQNIEPISNCFDLRYLDITNTMVSDIEVIGRFPKLEELFLSGHVQSLDCLENLTNLKRLFFRRSEIIRSLEALTNLLELEEIVISDSITDLSPIDHLPKVKRLVGFGIPFSEERRYQSLHPKTKMECGPFARVKLERMVSKLNGLKIKG